MKIFIAHTRYVDVMKIVISIVMTRTKNSIMVDTKCHDNRNGFQGPSSSVTSV